MFVIYDSTFDGLLSAIAYCFRNNLKPLALISELEPTPLSETIHLPCERNIRRLFLRHLASILGQSGSEMVLDTVFRAFLSERTGMATRIWQYLARTLELRRNPAGRLYEPAVAAVSEAAAKVGNQAHQYLGLLRFTSLDQNFFLADFSPDYHVLPLILPHFADRLHDQNFAIRDLKRCLAALHLSNGQISLHVLAGSDGSPDLPALLPDRLLTDGSGHAALCPGPEREPEIPHGYAGFPEMWQIYLQRLSIPERRNPNLQRANMPRKYWRYLTEDPSREKRQADPADGSACPFG